MAKQHECMLCEPRAIELAVFLEQTGPCPHTDMGLFKHVLGCLVKEKWLMLVQ